MSDEPEMAEGGIVPFAGTFAMIGNGYDEVVIPLNASILKRLGRSGKGLFGLGDDQIGANVD